MKYPTTVVSDGKYYNIDLDSEMEATAPGSSLRHARENDLLGLAFKTARDAEAAMASPSVQPAPTVAKPASPKPSTGFTPEEQADLRAMGRDATGKVIAPSKPTATATTPPVESSAAKGQLYTAPTTGSVWDRVRSYDQYTNASAIKYGISPDLIRSVMRHESGGDPKAISTSNAKGLMQHLDGTWRDMGGGDVFDPATSIDHGAKYLAKLKAEFGSDRAAVVAYHQGPGTSRGSLGKAVGPRTQQYERDVMSSVSESQNPSAPPVTLSAAARANFASIDPRLPVVLEGMRLMGYTPEQFGERMQNPEFIQEFYTATMKHAESLNPKLTIANGEQAYLDALKSASGPNDPKHPTPTVGRDPNPPPSLIQNPFSRQGQVEPVLGAAPPPVSQGGASGSWSNGASGTWEEPTGDAIARVEAKSVEQGQAAYDVVGRTVGKVAANLTRLAEDAIFAVVPRSADSSERASDVIQGGTDAMFGKPRNQTDVVVGGLLEFYLPFAKIAKPLIAMTPLTGKVASTVAGALTTIAQNPDDPTNSEAIESLIRGSDQPSEVRNLINTYILGKVGQSEFEQRLWKRVVRGTEDAAFGLALDTVVPLFKGIVNKIGEFRNYHAKPVDVPLRAPDALQSTPQVGVDSPPTSALDAPRIDSEATVGTSPVHVEETVQQLDTVVVKPAPTTRVGKDLAVSRETEYPRLDKDGIDQNRVYRSRDGGAMIRFGSIRTPQDMAETVLAVTKLVEIDPKYRTAELPSVQDIADQTGASHAEVQGYLNTVPGGAPDSHVQAIRLMAREAHDRLAEELYLYRNAEDIDLRGSGQTIRDLTTVIGDIGRQFRPDYFSNNSLNILSMTADGKLRITNPRAMRGDILVDDARKMILHLEDLIENANADKVSTGSLRVLDTPLDAQTGSLGSARSWRSTEEGVVPTSAIVPKSLKPVADYARKLTSPTFGGALSELWFNSVLGAFRTVSKTAWSAGEQLLLKPVIRFFGALEQSGAGSYKAGESPEMMEALIMYKSMVAGTPEMIRTMGNKLFKNVDTYLEKGGSLGLKTARERQFRAEAFEDIPFFRRIPLIGNPTKIPGVASFLNTTGAVLDFVGGRGLATVDEGLHFQVQRYELRAAAYRKSQGMVDLTAAQKAEWAENYIDEFNSTGAIDDETRAIITQQKKMSSFMQELGSEHGGFAGLGKFVANIEKSIGHNPLARVMFPFARSAFNTFQLKAELTPGLNLVSAQFRADMADKNPWVRAEAQGRFFTGMALATAAAGMGAAGITRGIQTTNPSYRSELERAGIPNNSITILGHTMRLDPNSVLGWFFSTFGAIGAMGYGNAVTEEELSASELALHTLAELLKSAPYMSAISDLMTTSDPRRLAARIEQEGALKVGLLTVDDIFLKPLWLPWQVGRGGQELIATLQSHKRVVDTYMDRLTARNGFGLDNPKQTDILGRVRFKGNGQSENTLNNAVVNIASLDVSNSKDALSLKLVRHGISIPDPSATFSKFDASVRLDDAEQQTLRELIFKPTGAAATLRESLEVLVARPEWDTLNSHVAQLMVDDLVSNYTQVAREQYFNRTPALQGKIRDKLKIQGLLK